MRLFYYWYKNRKLFNTKFHFCYVFILNKKIKICDCIRPTFIWANIEKKTRMQKTLLFRPQAYDCVKPCLTNKYSFLNGNYSMHRIAKASQLHAFKWSVQIFQYEDAKFMQCVIGKHLNNDSIALLFDRVSILNKKYSLLMVYPNVFKWHTNLISTHVSSIYLSI